MVKVFNVKFGLNRTEVISALEAKLLKQGKGYICAVDANVVSIANRNIKYLNIVNGSVINTCDGGTIAVIGRKIHGVPLMRYTGPDLFLDFISKNYNQVFLGNTIDNLDKLKNKMQMDNIDVRNFVFYPLPFCSVEDFDYKGISDLIRMSNADIIWVSLGAPKQEQFIANLLPYIEKGLLIAVGAAFNFYIGQGNYHRAPNWMQKLNIEWIYRLYLEPKKQFKRILFILKIYPSLIIKEVFSKIN